MHPRRSRYLRHRFPSEIISHAVWLYHRYGLSFRDVEDLLAERGIIATKHIFERPNEAGVLSSRMLRRVNLFTVHRPDPL